MNCLRGPPIDTIGSRVSRVKRERSEAINTMNTIKSRQSYIHAETENASWTTEGWYGHLTHHPYPQGGYTGRQSMCFCPWGQQLLIIIRKEWSILETTLSCLTQSVGSNQWISQWAYSFSSGHVQIDSDLGIEMNNGVADHDWGPEKATLRS